MLFSLFLAYLGITSLLWEVFGAFTMVESSNILSDPKSRASSWNFCSFYKVKLSARFYVLNTNLAPEVWWFSFFLSFNFCNLICGVWFQFNFNLIPRVSTTNFFFEIWSSIKFCTRFLNFYLSEVFPNWLSDYLWESNFTDVSLYSNLVFVSLFGIKCSSFG